MTFEDALFDKDFSVTAITPALPGSRAFAKPASGITVHYTADRSLLRLASALRERGLAYHLIIERDGTIHRGLTFGMAANHAGKALWRGQSPNRAHLAIALVSWGHLERAAQRFTAWNGDDLLASDVRHRPYNGRREMAFWDAAPPAQEKALLDVLRWFVRHGLSPDDVCGHDECALPAGRKTDPGGVIMPMADVRSVIAVTA